MSFNLPDLIWTVICFALFTLVLNGLLIKPVLKHMDERNAKIARARAKAEERRLAAEEAQRLAAEEAALAADEAARAERELLKAESERARAELESFERELALREEESLRGLEELAEEADSLLDSRIDGMAEAFTNKLLSGGHD